RAERNAGRGNALPAAGFFGGMGFEPAAQPTSADATVERRRSKTRASARKRTRSVPAVKAD
ncbi:MAG TPA: hypothetical protein PKC26_04815, partial [Plasticicumulans sp.]|nr:hypothetical protein [Plasticicumulans sp.]